MNAYFRIQREPAEALLNPKYVSSNHRWRTPIDIKEVDGRQQVKVHAEQPTGMFYGRSALPKDVSRCNRCGGLRITDTQMNALSVAADALPSDWEFSYVCLLLPGVCALESIDEIRAHIYHNGNSHWDRPDSLVVHFEGIQTGEVSDGLVVRPTRIIEAKPLSEWD